MESLSLTQQTRLRRLNSFDLTILQIDSNQILQTLISVRFPAGLSSLQVPVRQYLSSMDLMLIARLIGPNNKK